MLSPTKWFFLTASIRFSASAIGMEIDVLRCILLGLVSENAMSAYKYKVRNMENDVVNTVWNKCEVALAVRIKQDKSVGLQLGIWSGKPNRINDANCWTMIFGGDLD